MTKNEKIAADLGAAVSAFALALLSRAEAPQVEAPQVEATETKRRGRPAKDTAPERTEPEIRAVETPVEEKKPEIRAVETPVVETPVVETPVEEKKPETPVVETPVVEAPVEDPNDPTSWSADVFRAAVMERVVDLGSAGAQIAVDIMAKHSGAKVKAGGVPVEKRAAVLADLDDRIGEGAI